MTTQTSELVQVEVGLSRPGVRWQPVVGSEGESLVSRQTQLTDNERHTLLSESRDILSRCLPPREKGRLTGLVVGHIQSGKTLSFTTVAALARDNKYRLIIIITGTVKILNEQSVSRIFAQLRTTSRRDYAWKTYRNPTRRHQQEIKGALDDWTREVTSGLPPQTVLITVLKHHIRLKNLASLLESLDLQGVPALIIDDESDQAGLNTMARRPGDARSATNRQIERIRRATPHHTYLGYTATPQAPLLINILDTLSPEFVKVLTPGHEYTGGADFLSHVPPLVRVIPDADVPRPHQPPPGPPGSLLEAMRVFFLGVADGIHKHSEASARNRSMLVHPSTRTADHADFYRWVQFVKTSWDGILSEQPRSSDYDELIDDFQKAYADLRDTDLTISSFADLVETLPQAIRGTSVHEINSNVPDEIGDHIDEFWRRSYSTILVGGQKLERGFTVEGLTVTYMPRGVGVGNADSIQQRARFYGYNRSSLGICRVYLESDARDAYASYVDAEEDLRKRLEEFTITGKPLQEWRRMFFLDASLKPTRNNVLDIDYTRGPSANSWSYPLPPIYLQSSIEDNRRLVETLTSRLNFIEDDGDIRRTPAQKHLVDRSVSLREVLENILVPWKVTDPDDARDFTAVRLLIQRSIESNGDESCSIYRMSDKRTEGRSLSKGRIQPFQGRNPSTGYPGDRALHTPGRVTIQLHHYPMVSESPESLRSGQAIATGVDQLAIWIPSRIARGMVVQPQGG